ncbi:MAG: pseudaminic acid synthase [Rhodospirillaceae bacterium]
MPRLNLESQSSHTIQIGNREVGVRHPPLIIAEISANHGGDYNRAIRIIDGAAEAGADAIKFQAYTADSLTINSKKDDFLLAGPSLWQGQRLYDLYTSSATPYEWFPSLFRHCRERNLIPFASPFDENAVDMLKDLESPAYKIASFEAVDHGLISACAATGKPLIISTGLCNRAEIQEAIAAAQSAGGKDIVLLHCNSSYPAKRNEANLMNITALAKEFNVPVGYSDHTLGTISAAAACAIGACMIEKHVIDSPFPKTADSAFSLTPDLLKNLVQDCYAAWTSRGCMHDGPTETEKASLIFRRSLYIVKNITAGERFTSENIRSIRPGYGLPPKYMSNILGKPATRALEIGEALQWEMVEGGLGKNEKSDQ